MKIVADCRIPGLKEGVESRFPDADLLLLEGKDIKKDHVADADALIVRTRTRCDAPLLEGSRVKLIGTATIGTDHIDIPWCEANGIRVTSAPGCNAPAVMQYVAAALHEAGFDPASQTLGVVGKGNIGSLVVDLYRRAGCNVLVCDPPRKDADLDDENYLSLEEVLEKSDAVTFHVPYTLEGPHPTHHLLSGRLPEKPGIIVNASRGSVIDRRIIEQEWENRKFIIDTWPFEEHPEEFDLEEEKWALIFMSFIATPHIAGYSIEGKRRATEAMLAALEGRECDYHPEVEASSRIPLQKVVESFPIMEVSEQFKRNGLDFELLRASHLRPEPPIKF